MQNHSKFCSGSRPQTSALLADPLTGTESIPTQAFCLSKGIGFCLMGTVLHAVSCWPQRAFCEAPRKALQAPPEHRLCFAKHYSSKLALLLFSINDIAIEQGKEESFLAIVPHLKF